MNSDYQCLNCGMQVPRSEQYCPKCDAELALQSSGEIVHVDIAHNAETISVALAKLEKVLEEAALTRAAAVRLGVGRGLIRDEVLRQLSWLQHSEKVQSFDYDRGNTGAIFVKLLD